MSSSFWMGPGKTPKSPLGDLLMAAQRRALHQERIEQIVRRRGILPRRQERERRMRLVHETQASPGDVKVPPGPCHQAMIASGLRLWWSPNARQKAAADPWCDSRMSERASDSADPCTARPRTAGSRPCRHENRVARRNAGPRSLLARTRGLCLHGSPASTAGRAR